MKPPISYFGGKLSIAPRLIDLFPPHRSYVEACAGSLAVLLAKTPASGLEVVNDLDGHLMTFWRVLRDHPTDLARICALTPHSRAEQANSWPIPDEADDLEAARRVWVMLTQGYGRQLRSSGWRHHLLADSSMPGYLRTYLSRLAPAAERLQNATLECLPAIEIVERYGRDPDTLIYVDPPYLYGTRAKTGMYQHEMGHDDEHRDLAAAAAACKSAVVISGYAHPLYDDDLYDGWHRAEIATGTGMCATKGYQERVEVIWCNRPLSDQGLLGLLGEEVGA